MVGNVSGIFVTFPPVEQVDSLGEGHSDHSGCNPQSVVSSGHVGVATFMRSTHIRYTQVCCTSGGLGVVVGHRYFVSCL